MRKLIAILAVALAIPTMSFAGGEGRYQGVDPNSGDGIWIVDTKLGAVKYCYYIPDLSDFDQKIKQHQPELFDDKETSSKSWGGKLICDAWSIDNKLDK